MDPVIGSFIMAAGTGAASEFGRIIVKTFAGKSKDRELEPKAAVCEDIGGQYLPEHDLCVLEIKDY